MSCGGNVVLYAAGEMRSVFRTPMADACEDGRSRPCPTAGRAVRSPRLYFPQSTRLLCGNYRGVFRKLVGRLHVRAV